MRDAELVRAWLAARSLARGLPAPVADHGGWRVDSGQPDERRRFVFLEPIEGLRTLGAAIDEPCVALKLCCPGDALMALLPARWRLAPPAWMMARDAPAQPAAPMLPPGYGLAVERDGALWTARISDAGGALAAQGHAIEAEGLFVYDRIRTQDDHQRRGLGRALMQALGRCRRATTSRELLTATIAGRALYLTLGWRERTCYSTATIPM